MEEKGKNNKKVLIITLILILLAAIGTIIFLIVNKPTGIKNIEKEDNNTEKVKEKSDILKENNELESNGVEINDDAFTDELLNYYFNGKVDGLWSVPSNGMGKLFPNVGGENIEFFELDAAKKIAFLIFNKRIEFKTENCNNIPNINTSCGYYGQIDIGKPKNETEVYDADELISLYQKIFGTKIRKTNYKLDDSFVLFYNEKLDAFYTYEGICSRGCGTGWPNSNYTLVKTLKYNDRIEIYMSLKEEYFHNETVVENYNQVFTYKYNKENGNYYIESIRKN